MFYRKSCARAELKTVKDNLPSQHLRGKPLAFDHRLCPGTREFEPLPGWGGEFEPECQAAVQSTSRKSRSSILPSTKKLGGAFQQFFSSGRGGEWRDMKKPIIKSESAPRLKDGQLKTGEQLRFACLHKCLGATLDKEVRQYCTRTSNARKKLTGETQQTQYYLHFIK